MSMPPEMMARLKAGAQTPSLPGGARPGPSAAPMATPEKKEGKKQKGYLKAHIGMNQFEEALSIFGAESEEGKVILKILTMAAKTFGQNDTSDLIPAEMASIVEGMPQVGGGAPQQKALMQSMGQPPQPARFPGAPAPMPMPQA